MLSREFLKGRHRIIPGQLAVTLTRAAGGTATGTGERRPITKSTQLFSEIEGLSDAEEWILHFSEISTPPVPGDRIASGSESFLIEQVTCELLQTRYRCIATKRR